MGACRIAEPAPCEHAPTEDAFEAVGCRCPELQAEVVERPSVAARGTARDLVVDGEMGESFDVRNRAPPPRRRPRHSTKLYSCGDGWRVSKTMDLHSIAACDTIDA